MQVKLWIMERMGNPDQGGDYGKEEKMWSVMRVIIGVLQRIKKEKPSNDLPESLLISL